MFLSGHEHILLKSLKHVNKKFNKKQLKDGVFYPDIPCGKRKLVLKNGLLKNIEYTHKLCSHFAVMKVFGETTYGAEELYQSHRGKFAVNHAQTPDPKYTMEEVQYKIIRKCCLWYHLALTTGNQIWLGMLLHAVADSYSPAHTYRVANNKIVNKTYVKGKVTPRYKFEKNPTLKATSQIYTLVKSGVFYKTKFASEAKLIDFALKKIPYLKTRNREQIENIVTDTLFYDMSFKKMEKSFNVKSALKKKKWKKNIDPTYKYITNFYWVRNQKPLFHQMHNTIDAVKNTGNYERAIRNTTDILDMFGKKKRLSEVCDYLYREVFNVHPVFLKQKSGRDM